MPDKKVEIAHPELEKTAWVMPEAVRAWERRGWALVEKVAEVVEEGAEVVDDEAKKIAEEAAAKALVDAGQFNKTRNGGVTTNQGDSTAKTE